MLLIVNNLIENETFKHWSNMYMSEMGNSFCKYFWNKVKNITDHQSGEITQPLFDNSGTLEWGDQEIQERTTKLWTGEMGNVIDSNSLASEHMATNDHNDGDIGINLVDY